MARPRRGTGFVVETVRQPPTATGHRRFSAIDRQVRRRSASPRSPRCTVGRRHHRVDKVQTALPAAGRHVVIDATQSAGVVAMDVTRLDPDAVIFPTYKWLVGPYGRAFLYVAETPPERRTAGADLRRPPQREFREPGLFRRPRLMSTTRGVTTWANATFHHAGNGLDRHGDDGGMGRR